MFEESMVESLALPVPSVRRWTMAASLILQISLALTFAVLPLLHPERPIFHATAPLIFTPPPHRPPVVVQSTTSAKNSTTSTMIPVTAHTFAPMLPGLRQQSIEDAPPLANPGLNMGNGIPSLLTDQPSHGPSVSSASVQNPAKAIRVSGLSVGMLITPIRPIYPAIARAAKVSGQVIVEATISKTGTIESLQVTAGPQLLRQAALEAIKAARYRPFLLNGQPVEVQTTITVNFNLGQ